MSAVEVYRALWRHKLFLLLGTAAIAVAAWFAVSREAPTYSASALVRVQEHATDPGQAVSSLQAGQTLAETYSTILSSGALNARIAQLAGRGGTPVGPSFDVSARTVQDLDLFWVSAHARSGAAAAALANAAPRALRESARRTGSVKAVGDVAVVKPASAPDGPSSPKTVLDVVLAVVVGLIFSGALALLFELVSDRLPDPDQLERVFGQPVLAAVPSVPLGVVQREEQAEREAAPESNGRSQRAMLGGGGG